MNSKTLFCNQLAEWFSVKPWRYTTLLTVLIETVEHLPEDADQLVSEVLLALPYRQPSKTIAGFLQQSERIKHWFVQGANKPQITQYNLQRAPAAVLANENLPTLNSVGDLTAWLGITYGQLEWLADLKRYEVGSPAYFQHYHYRIVKKRDGRNRLIESPKGLLKFVQAKIARKILPFAATHNAAHGFVKGRNCRTHASHHVNKHYLFLFDLAHCFHSIHWANVFRVFASLGYTSQISRYLSALLTHRAYPKHPVLSALDDEQLERVKRRHLPQGAPSSPSLSNIALMPLDKRFSGLARSLKLDYSRYADDLAFSGNEHRDWRFLETLVGSICNEEHFALNYRKTRVLLPRQRQMVTGIVVNEKLNIDRTYYENLKAVLTNCVRQGIHSQNHANHLDFSAHLQGRIQHVKSLNVAKGIKLEKIFMQIKS